MTIRLDVKDRVFIGAVALVHIVFFLMACRFTRIYMGDSFEYIYEALNIRRYFFFYSGNPAMPIIPEYMTQRQPLYPLFLLFFYFFTVNNWVVIIAQNLISIANIYYTRKIFLRVGYQKKYDWVLLLFVVCYPAQFINANTIAPDILLQTCTLLYLGSFVSLLQERQMKAAVRMSLALAAGLLVKAVLYPFVIVHAAILIIVAASWKMKMQRLVLIAIFPLCVVLTYNFWNYTRTEKFHFTSNQSFNAIYYFYPFLSGKVGADSANRFLKDERKAYDAISDYKDRYDFANEEGMALLKQNFFPYMLFHISNSARIFIEPGKAEIDLFTGRLTYGRLYRKEETGFYTTWRKEGWSGLARYVRHNPSLPFVVIILLFNCLRLLGLWWFFTSRKIPGMLRVFIFIVTGYFAMAAGPIANTRYFLPVSLIIIGCAVTGFCNKQETKKIVPAHT